jgi:Flp pilus assembly protein TadG
MSQCQKRPIRVYRGTSALEMSVVLLILMYITLGAVEYGWLFLKQEQITNAAREAARLAITPSATNSSVSAEIGTLMSSYGLANSGYTSSLPSNVATVSVGSTLSVGISVTYSNIEITHFSMLPLPSTVSATVTMVKEGP